MIIFLLLIASVFFAIATFASGDFHREDKGTDDKTNYFFDLFLLGGLSIGAAYLAGTLA